VRTRLADGVLVGAAGEQQLQRLLVVHQSGGVQRRLPVL
jgi:hypothetical protein